MSELLEGCFKCRSRDSVGFVLMSTNSAGGKVFKIKCEKCGLCSPEESLRPRLVKWWNERKNIEPSIEVLKAFEYIYRTLEKKGKTDTTVIRKNLAVVLLYFGINKTGGSE